MAPKRKVRKCCVPSCNEVKTDANHFHRVPAQRDRLDAWENALGRKLTSNLLVCSSHFFKEDYIPSGGTGQRPNLKRIAIPHIVQFHEGTPIINPIDQEARRAILEELECLTPDMTVTAEECNSLKKDAENILTIIESEAAFYSNVTSKISELVNCAGCLGPFTLFPDLQKSLFLILERYFSKTCNPEVYQGGLLKEVLVLSVMKMKQFNYEDACTYVEETSVALRIESSNGI